MTSKGSLTKEFNIMEQPQNVRLYSEKIEGMNPTTAASYMRRWVNLLEQQPGETMIEKITSIGNFLVGIYSNSEYKSDTCRQYKAAALYGLGRTVRLLQNNKISMDEIANGLSLNSINRIYVQVLSCKRTENESVKTKKNMMVGDIKVSKTSSLKMKSFPQEFYKYMQSKTKLGNQKKSLHLTFSFVKANLLLGLRPIEWSDAYFGSNVKTKDYIVVVKNGKDSQGRANGSHRVLDLKHITITEKKAIFGFLKLWNHETSNRVMQFKEKQKAYEQTEEYRERMQDTRNLISKNDKYTPLKNHTYEMLFNQRGEPKNAFFTLILNAIQKDLYRIYNEFCDESGRDRSSALRPTLYSTRHQCIANAKAEQLDKYIIAAFFGHSGVNTASKYYGKAWSGWSKFKFKPDVSSVYKVNGFDSCGEVTKLRILSVLSGEQNSISLAENVAKKSIEHYYDDGELFSDMFSG